MNKELNKKIYNLILSKNTNDLKKVFEANQDLINFPTPIGSWLQIAVRNADLNTIQVLIDLGADIHSKGNIAGENVLADAASEGKIDILEYFLKKGVCIDTSEPERNPLFRAIQENNLDVVKLLVKHGINYKIAYTGKIMKNMDAIAYAKEWGSLEIVKYLESL